jgi:hypothetical protein
VSGGVFPGFIRAEAKTMINPSQKGAGRNDVQFHFSPVFYTKMVKWTKHFTSDRWGVEAALA